MSLGLICRKGLGSTLKNLGIVDHFWEIQKGNSESYRTVLSELKNYDINLLLSAHTSFRTTLFCAQINAVKKITFKKPWNFFAFNERVHWPVKLPESLRLLSLLQNHSSELHKLFSELPDASEFIQKQRGGKLLAPPAWADPSQGWLPQNNSDLLNTYNLKNKNWIALFPGSVWATKMWKKEGFMELGRSLQQLGYQIAVMGGPEEKVLGQEVADSIPEALNLCGKTSLLDSLKLLSQANMVVGNDSSSSHMAALVGVPVVAIYGPTVLKFGYRPWAKKSAVVEIEGMSCRPCGPHGHKKCPLGHHNCMQKLEASEVLRVVQSMLPNN